MLVGAAKALHAGGQFGTASIRAQLHQQASEFCEICTSMVAPQRPAALLCA